MITFLSIVWLGFFLGMRHATDPDHVVAVSTIVSRQRSIRNAAGIGIMWGIGHTLTLMLVGGAIFICGFAIPRKLGLSMELSVGIMLVALGAVNLKSMADWLADNFKNRGRSRVEGAVAHDLEEPHHDADHGSAAHHAAERAATSRLDAWFGRSQTYWLFRPLVVGLVHGLGGSAAVALLVLPLIHQPLGAFVYLLVFGVGTIAGMLLVTAAIAVPFACAATRSPALHRRLSWVSGFISLAFGLFLLYQIGFVQGLFLK
ncbi:MAG TPA: high-affinity nickel-transport family protein [Verrucomicrobiae bacterium]|nr:high-affinity nickel-transport family protein [Verrucomicrobiae bacterium]